jgi:hypothetical protein
LQQRGSIKCGDIIINNNDYATVTPISHDEHSQLAHISHVSDTLSGDYFPVLVDGGAAGSTSNDRSFLHGYNKLTAIKVFYDVAKRAHHSVGEGYTKLACGPTEREVHAHVMIHYFHTPSITVTVLYPRRFVLRHSTKYEAHTIYATHKTHRGYARIHGLGGFKDIYIPGILRGALLYSRALCPPCHSPYLSRCRMRIMASVAWSFPPPQIV